MEGVLRGRCPEKWEIQGRNRLRHFWNSAESVKFSGLIPGDQVVVLENSKDLHGILVGFAFPGRKSVNREGQFRRGRSGGFGGSGEDSQNFVNFLRILIKTL